MKKHRKNSRRGIGWRKFAYKHTLGAIIATVIFVLIIDTTIVQAFMNEITALGYIGILLAGILFVSFFTAAPSIVLLLAFAERYHPLMVALLAGCGAMIGDYIILKFAEDKIGHELKPIAKQLKLNSFLRLLHKKRFKPVTATVGALIIASPFPDEAGIALLGLSRISTMQLLAVTLGLNCAGILVLIYAFN